MSATIIRGDARTLPLPDSSVDLIVTSPPYFGLRSYQDGGQHYDGQIGAEPTSQEYVAALLECTREWMRILKPEGSIFVNLGDKYDSDKSLMFLPERYRIGCRDELRLIGRAVVIWSKPNGLPESVTDRVRRSHEDWVHLTKGSRYFSAVDEIREPHTAPERNHGASAMRGRNVNLVRTGTGTYVGPNPLGKLPGSVWEIATQPLKAPAHLEVDHFAAFPMEWPRRIISGWSPTGGVVLDPFGGTGTTALVADTLGRRGVSIDRSADYCRLAAWRTTNPAERARALGVPKPPKPMDGQGDLFEAAS
jgi:site-specific DNA-methyltransferase (cytosine-N4-specific)